MSAAAEIITTALKVLAGVGCGCWVGVVVAHGVAQMTICWNRDGGGSDWMEMEVPMTENVGYQDPGVGDLRAWW